MEAVETTNLEEEIAAATAELERTPENDVEARARATRRVWSLLDKRAALREAARIEAAKTTPSAVEEKPETQAEEYARLHAAMIRNSGGGKRPTVEALRRHVQRFGPEMVEETAAAFGIEFKA